MIICPNCNTPSDDTNRFCANCGSKLEHKQFCPQCGESLDINVKFCPQCGCNLKNPTASHGTGCTLSAALAALTALEFPWEEVVVAAKSFVLGSLRENVEIGKDVFGMYPPMEDASAFVDLYEYKGSNKGKSKKKA